MKKFSNQNIWQWLLIALLLTGLLCVGCTRSSMPLSDGASPPSANDVLAEDGQYTAPEEVAAYLQSYGHLPDNFLTKKEAKSLGWDSQKGNLQDVAPGMSIGGDVFGNREGLLPSADNRKYYECDVNYAGGYRNGERIIYSNDGLIFYTKDHYKSFEQLY